MYRHFIFSNLPGETTWFHTQNHTEIDRALFNICEFSASSLHTCRDTRNRQITHILDCLQELDDESLEHVQWIVDHLSGHI